MKLSGKQIFLMKSKGLEDFLLEVDEGDEEDIKEEEGISTAQDEEEEDE